jgi:hypothetical protein
VGQIKKATTQARSSLFSTEFQVPGSVVMTTCAWVVGTVLKQTHLCQYINPSVPSKGCRNRRGCHVSKLKVSINYTGMVKCEAANQNLLTQMLYYLSSSTDGGWIVASS